MALVQRLDLRQTQTLVMTPQLQQAIKLLQLSNLELTDYVAAEIERNPLLERDDGHGDGVGADPADPGATAAAPGPDVTGTDRLTGAETLTDGADAPLDTDFENVWTSDDLAGSGFAAEAAADWSGRGGRTDFADPDVDLEQTLAGGVSLRDHLFSQISIDFTEPGDRIIGAFLVDQLDEAGYLTGDPADVADRLGCAEENVTRVIARLQRLDPPGVFARSLAECLALQLAERDRLDPAMQALLDNLELLAKRDLAMLGRLCGVDMEDLTDMIAEIRSLDPKPALAFTHEVAQTVTPDILMRPGTDGGWIVELNTDNLPKVLVNQRYYAQVSDRVVDRKEKDYLADCFASANWLVKSLHQRATTILKVASEIVSQQDGFIRHGVSALRPLILRDVADAIAMHESTVSRVTTNKFIATPRGLFELKYFFSVAIQGADGAAAHSAEAVRHRLKTLIDGEPADAVLSDDRIVELLRSEGIDIARRTVAKYREFLRIPSSVQRRREKSLRPAP